MILKFFKNPLSIWLKRTLNNLILEFQNKNLSIGYMASIRNSKFSNFNEIQENVVLNNVQLGDLSYVAYNTNISNSYIGKFSSIGPNCNINLPNHPTNFISTHPFFYSKKFNSNIESTIYSEKEERVIIGNDVWIGANVLILGGIKIGHGAIVAAGSIVTKDVACYEIVAGIPARKIKQRFNSDRIDQILDSKWWDMPIENLSPHRNLISDINGFLNTLNYKS